MSNTQNDTVLQQRHLQQRHLQQQAQQRQILAMMGIGQWIQPSSATLSIDDIVNATTLTDVSDSAQLVQPSVESPVLQSTNNQDPSDLSASPPSALADIDDNAIVNPVNNAFADVLEDIIEAAPTVADSVQPLIERVTAPIGLKSTGISHDKSIVDKVAPFDLQGGRYNNWVLIVDIQALNSDSQKLWQNITKALSLECETISFPICAGMDTAELANASLAGYLFKIGRTEESQVAALTELPSGLTHPNLVDVATLEAMLSDSMLKHQLWEQISQ